MMRMALNPEQERLLKRVYQSLADRPLEPGDPFYEPIYQRPEGEDPVAMLKRRISYSDVESLHLFSGFRGTGKTTELLRLGAELEQQGYLVLYASALEYLSGSEEVDIVTMLMAVAGAFGEQIEKKTGTAVSKEGFWRRIGNYLSKTTLEVSELSPKLEIASPAKSILGELKAGLDLKVALKTAPSFRQKLHDFMANRLGELKREVNAFTEEGVKAVRDTRGQPGLQVVFLFDQFEQIRGSRTNEQAVIRSVERLFANYMEALRLPLVHVIYTVPPWLQFVLPGAFSIEILPCVRLWENDRQRSRYPAGWRSFREAILKRFTKEGFRRLFGTDTEIGQGMADKLIAQSGGHFRDLLRLFREATVLVGSWRPTLPMTPEVLQRAIANVRNEFLPISAADARWLAEIGKLRNTALPDSSPENVGRLSRFLDTHLVLYLTNGEGWYDIHPLIREQVEALARLPLPPKT